RQVFQSEKHSSPYMEKYVGEALYMMRLPDDAIARIKERFKDMTDHHYTTLWEDWRIGGSGGGTINHAWSGGALTLLSQYGAGVAPTEPGYKTYHVLPQMGPLKIIKTVIPSVRGDIQLELFNRPDTFIMNLTSLPATEAVIGIPKSNRKITGIVANETPVWCNGKRTNEMVGLTFLEETDHYIKFSVKPGSWHFKAKKDAPNNNIHGTQ
ncbi:MAG TPA: alpha-L-rhamnosidase C-terminal domain-containing protein, partial [Tichowtungia sp.]|nr:alpha-L-rhamnosidase C-terminal domain-containing protein [Tichowtungia sp.]